MSDEKVMLLTGASRGIGHATVKRFEREGWRVLTCSRQPFDPRCPWKGGKDNHIQIDLGDPTATMEELVRIREKLDGKLHALVNNAGISPKGPGGARLNSIETDLRDWGRVFHVNFFAPIVLARGLKDELSAAGGAVVKCDLDRRKPRPPLRRRCLFDLEGGAEGADAGNGARLRPIGRARQRHRPGRDRNLDPVAGYRKDRGNPAAAPSWPTVGSGGCDLVLVFRPIELCDRHRNRGERGPARLNLRGGDYCGFEYLGKEERHCFFFAKILMQQLLQGAAAGDWWMEIPTLRR